MRQPRVTIRSVAKEAGVSITTVSNVLNGRHEQMGVDTRDRVLAAMKRLGYHPNHLAQSLVTRRTATIGLIMNNMTNSLYPPVTIGAEAACRAAGYGLLLANATDSATEHAAVDLMLSKPVDGLVLFSISNLDAGHDHLMQAQREGLPIVTINRHLPAESGLPAVAFDHQGGARQATQHLLDLGHRRIAHIAGPSHRLTGLQRRWGYEEALREAGIDPDPVLTVEGDYSFESGEAAMHRLAPYRPTAVFVAGDVMALGAVRALTRLSIAVPRDCSVVAFGDPDCIRYATPAMTTIDLPVAEAGQVAVDLVLRHIAGQKETEVKTLRTTLLVRETTSWVMGDG
jgi:LacI family transcriptional regulator